VNVGYFILQDARTDFRIAVLNGLVWISATVIIVVRNKMSANKQQVLPNEPRSSTTMPSV
jgi:hypothetical protein